MKSDSDRSRAVSKLAIFGGAPAFAEPLHVGRPNIPNRETFTDRVNDILDRRWLTNDGQLVLEFERTVAKVARVKHCLATCNATMALTIAIRALRLSGEVIVPSFTFIATAHVLQWQGITPVFCDIDPDRHTLDPGRLEEAITPRTTGIIGVHVWGRPCDTAAIDEIARRRNLRVIYDASHAFGCSHAGRMIGGAGACEVFSFHATKCVNSFEGGAVVTNDDQLAEKIRLMRNFGFSTYDRVIELGINGKMTEICAAMGLTSIEAMPEVLAINRRNYDVYRETLSGLPGISVIEYDPAERHNYHYIVVEVDPRQSPLNRDELVAVLHAENILARKYFWPGCHRMEPYRSLQPDAGRLLPQTERVAERVLTLPTGQSISTDMVHSIGDIIGLALEQATEIRELLKQQAPEMKDMHAVS